MKKFPSPVEHIKAETLLSTFTSSCSDILIETQGVFSRNYNDDVISLEVSDEYKNFLTLALSRDSVFHILPEGLFFKEEVLRELAKKGDSDKFKAEEERIRKEKKKILLFFQPFDTVYFRLRFELEKQLNKLSENRIKALTDKIFDVYPIEEDAKNPFIRRIVPLLPYASEIRGNMLLMKDVLKKAFYPAQIDLYTIRQRKESGNWKSLLKIIVHIEKLSAAQFRNLKKEADVFGRFFYEWFLPVDLEYHLKIKDTRERFVLGKAMTLDYNTYLR